MKRMTLAAGAVLALTTGACSSSTSQADTAAARTAATRFACPAQQAMSTAVGNRSVPKPKRTMPASLTIICSYARPDADPTSPILIFAITFGTTAGQLESIARTTAEGKVSPVSGLGAAAFQSRSDGQLQVFAENRGRSVSCTFGDEDHLTSAQRNAALTLFL